ncbi:MAG: STAS domain-containing protein [bacterium]
MDIVEKNLGGITILEMSGRFDATASFDLSRNVSSLLEEGRRDIVLNMNGVDYINSAALGSLINLRKKVAARGGHLKLAKLQSWVERVFKETRLDRFFEVYDTEAEAINSFGE